MLAKIYVRGKENKVVNLILLPEHESKEAFSSFIANPFLLLQLLIQYEMDIFNFDSAHNDAKQITPGKAYHWIIAK